MALKDLFQKEFETREKPVDPALKSHHYYERRETVIDAVRDMLTMAEYFVEQVDYDRGEIGFTAGKALGTATITALGPLETVVDFFVYVPRPLSFGRGKKIIIDFYQKLDNTLKVRN